MHKRFDSRQKALLMFWKRIVAAYRIMHAIFWRSLIFLKLKGLETLFMD